VGRERKGRFTVPKLSILRSIAALCALSACGEAPMTAEELGQNEEGLCDNGDGVNSAMAALAVATANELRRWQPSSDFVVSNNLLALSATGKSQCSDRKCLNTQAILDLQKAPLGSVKFGKTAFVADNFKSRIVAEYNEQKICEARPGTQAANCPAEAHKLTLKSSQPGACDTVYTFNATTPTGGVLKSPAQLKNKLIYVGFPENPFLGFTNVGSSVSIDPTFGLNDDGTTNVGACTAACTRFSRTDLSRACCSCNGSTRTYSRSPFSSVIFLCR
jgi:hypothetical protein